MIFFVSIFVAVGFAVGIYCDWRKLDESKETRDWYISWAIRGIVAPSLVWMFFNLGLLSSLPSFSLRLDLQHRFSTWLPAYCEIVGLGIYVIISFWSTLTCGWLLNEIRLRVRDRREFWGFMGVWSLLLSPAIALVLYTLGWFSVGIVGALWFLVLIHYTLPLAMLPPEKPVYSRAIAKMQSGKYEEAEAEVILELEKHENDFEGWLMLAELYANQFEDMAAADRTIHEMCEDPNITVSQISVALHRLADWYLKKQKDPVAARRVLEEICERLPETHLDKMARIRLNSLPKTKQELVESEKVRTIKMPPVQGSADLRAEAGEREMPRDLAVAQANQYSEKLRKNPNDIASREALARLMAEQLEKVDMALEQMELLLDMTLKTPKQAATWLSLMAAWHIRFRHDDQAAMRILERLVRDYPQTQEAFTAQRRLSFLRHETRTPRIKVHSSLADF